MKWQKYRRKYARKQAIVEGTNHWKNKRPYNKLLYVQINIIYKQIYNGDINGVLP